MTEKCAKRPLRWGIIGCGLISNDFVRALKYCSNPHQVVAVAETYYDNGAVEFCKRVNLPSSVNAYDSYDKILADPNVDVIYIGALNNAHFEWTLKATEAGKAVLCEKPMGVNAAQVRQMAAAARRHKVFLMEAFWSRFFPVWRYIRDMIDSGKYGAVKYCGANFGIIATKSRLDPSHCETPFMDIGLYTVMFALFVNRRPPKKIHVFSELVENGSDLWANITLDFGDAIHAACSYSGAAYGTNAAFVSFEKGQIQIPEFFWAPTRLLEFETPARAGVTRPRTLEFSLNDHDDQPKFIYNNSSGLRYEADHVYECIQQGKLESDEMSLDESIWMHEVVTEVRQKIGVVFAQDEQAS